MIIRKLHGLHALASCGGQCSLTCSICESESINKMFPSRLNKSALENIPGISPKRSCDEGFFVRLQLSCLPHFLHGQVDNSSERQGCSMAGHCPSMQHFSPEVTASSGTSFVTGVTRVAMSQRDAPSLRFPMARQGLFMAWGHRAAAVVGPSRCFSSMPHSCHPLPPSPFHMGFKQPRRNWREAQMQQQTESPFPAALRGQAWSWNRSAGGTTTSLTQHQTWAANTSQPRGISLAG